MEKLIKVDTIMFSINFTYHQLIFSILVVKLLQ